MTETARLGGEGEDAAARFLEGKRLKVLSRHYQTRWGEIDLICQDGETIVFVEVKARTHASHISALDVITPAKQKKIVGAALSFMKLRRLTDRDMRFDVVTIEADRLEWIPGAFEPTLPYTS